MNTIGLSEHIDLALIALYLFWVFFFGLVLYLNREGMREGFPAVSETTGKPLDGGLIGLPMPKTFKLREGVELQAPHPETYDAPLNAKPTETWGGAPLEPIGDPMLSAFGPGAYAERMDAPLLTHDGHLKIAPMRDLPDFSVVAGDQDPRGLPVVATDRAVAGEVVDIWVDREEQLIRYLEVELASDDAEAPKRRVLLPFTMAKVGGRWATIQIWRPEVYVASITAAQFANVPTTRLPNQVTLLEEDKITAYYGGGTLYATPGRREPLL